MKDTIAITLGKALSLMFVGLAYLILHRSFNTWYR